MNRYARDWDTYSQNWDNTFGDRYAHLGDEWCDDGTPERERENFYFDLFARRFLKPEMRILEIGPGGGKWTVRLAPLVKEVLVLDVSEEMLKRTQQRCTENGFGNVRFLLGNGRDMQPVEEESIDFIFSYDVFVHIAMEDTYAYIQEMRRVLKEDGKGICHHAINTTKDAWHRIEVENEFRRNPENTRGQYYYYSPESLTRMYEHCGLRINEQFIEYCFCVLMFEKPSYSMVPHLEKLLYQLVNSGSEEASAQEAIDKLYLIPDELKRQMQPILKKAETQQTVEAYRHAASRIRKLFRGG